MLDRPDRMPLAGVEGHHVPRAALRGLAGHVDRDQALDNGDHSPFADVVVAHFLAALELEDDGPALGGAEEDTRDLPVGP